jgi:hypothetical protein
MLRSTFGASQHETIFSHFPMYVKLLFVRRTIHQALIKQRLMSDLFRKFVSFWWPVPKCCIASVETLMRMSRYDRKDLQCTEIVNRTLTFICGGKAGSRAARIVRAFLSSRTVRET